MKCFTIASLCLLVMFSLTSSSQAEIEKKSDSELKSELLKLTENGLNKKWNALYEQFNETKFEDLNEYLEIHDKINSEIIKFLDNGEKLCRGDFSIHVFEDVNKSIVSDLDPTKSEQSELSKEEKKLCLGHLKSIHRKFLDVSLEARKKFLTKLHESNLKKLEKSYKQHQSQ